MAKNNLWEQQQYSPHLRRCILVQVQAQQVKWKEMHQLVVCVFLDSLTLKEAVIYVQSWGKPLLETGKLGHFHCQSICYFRKLHFEFLLGTVKVGFKINKSLIRLWRPVFTWEILTFITWTIFTTPYFGKRWGRQILVERGSLHWEALSFFNVIGMAGDII